jgi:hypothetical protein
MSGFGTPLSQVQIVNNYPVTAPDPSDPSVAYENLSTGNFYNVSSPTAIFEDLSITNASPSALVTVTVSAGSLWLLGSNEGTSFTTTVSYLSTLNQLVFNPNVGTPVGPSGVQVTISVPSSGLSNVEGVLGQTFTVYCFAEGTMIACPEGERAIETIRPGEMVLNAKGEAHTVRFVGRRELSFAEGAAHAPVVLPAGCLADGVPSRDLRVSPDHAIAIDGVLVTARALIGGPIRQECVDSVVYYHIQLDGHDVVLADGTPCETLLDADDPVGFDNAGDAPITDVFLAPCLPRMSQGEAVEAIRARIRERALVQA